MKEQTGSTFARKASIATVILALFIFSVVYVARDIIFDQDQGDNPDDVTLTEERIKPVADVYTGEDGTAAIDQAATTIAPEQAVAFDGSLDGEMIYNKVCFVCHATGAAGAPRPGTEAMSQRTEKGLDALMQTALNGLNAMPPRGGRADLSDEQIQAAVEFMMQ